MQIIIAGIGLTAGCAMEKITSVLILQRSGSGTVNRFSGNYSHTLAWMTLSALCWLCAFSLGAGYLETVKLALTISICIMLSAVDITTRKIPNKLLGALMLLEIAALVLGRKFSLLDTHFLGAVFGFIVFLLPSLFGRGAGLGDVKFAAVVGLSLGAYDFFIAVLLMSLFLLYYTVYLIVAKKGGLKTRVALGPFLASAFILVMAYDIVMPQKLYSFISQYISTFAS